VERVASMAKVRYPLKSFDGKFQIQRNGTWAWKENKIRMDLRENVYNLVLSPVKVDNF